MKTVKAVLTVVFTFMAITVFAQSKIDSVKVYGNCGMCKKRIEKAANIEGVNKVTWSVEKKQLAVSYDASKTNIDAIQQKIAAIGHDTEKFRAVDSTYEKLPGCCLYERKKADKKEDHSGHKQ